MVRERSDVCWGLGLPPLAGAWLILMGRGWLADPVQTEDGPSGLMPPRMADGDDRWWRGLWRQRGLRQNGHGEQAAPDRDPGPADPSPGRLRRPAAGAGDADTADPSATGHLLPRRSRMTDVGSARRPRTALVLTAR